MRVREGHEWVLGALESPTPVPLAPSPTEPLPLSIYQAQDMLPGMRERLPYHSHVYSRGDTCDGEDENGPRRRRTQARLSSTSVQRWKSCGIVTLGFRVGGRSRGRYATPISLDTIVAYSHVHVRRESLGFVHRSSTTLSHRAKTCRYDSQPFHRCTPFLFSQPSPSHTAPQVRLACPTDGQIHLVVREPATCRYVLTLYLPLVCNRPEYRPKTPNAASTPSQ
jgi:hypothetical protein